MDNNHNASRDAIISSLQNTIAVLTEALRKEQATHERTQRAYLNARAKLEFLADGWSDTIADLPRCSVCRQPAITQADPCGHQQCCVAHSTTHCVVAGCNIPIIQQVPIDNPAAEVVISMDEALSDAQEFCARTKDHADAMLEDLQKKGMHD